MLREGGGLGRCPKGVPGARHSLVGNGGTRTPAWDLKLSSRSFQGVFLGGRTLELFPAGVLLSGFRALHYGYRKDNDEVLSLRQDPT